jgi:hypothetical protein
MVDKGANCQQNDVLPEVVSAVYSLEKTRKGAKFVYLVCDRRNDKGPVL